MHSPVKIVTAAAEREDVPGRISWLSGFCRLVPLEAELLALVAGLHQALAPDPDGWPVSSLARRLQVPEPAVQAALQPHGPLRAGGLVRVSTAEHDWRVALSERIEQFLFAPPRSRV
jgi:hypothetical protein